ncbi:hypothetical protein BURK2_01263 [Burkholderiales bacterium]|nr:hypothetical protein BURK2_01263 [Burkholderiales bacterium]
MPRCTKVVELIDSLGFGELQRLTGMPLHALARLKDKP